MEPFGELRAMLHATGQGEVERIARCVEIIDRMEEPELGPALEYASRLLGRDLAQRRFGLRLALIEAQHILESARLAQATEHLYEIFARYPCPEELPDHSFAARPHALESWPQISSLPLREVEPSSLDALARRVLTTWGDEDFLRYLLPRLLQLDRQGDLLCEREILWGKIAYGNWRSWPEDEQEAIEEFVLACWRVQLLELGDPSMYGYHAVELEDTLCSLDRLDPTLVATALEIWRPALAHQPAHLLQLARFATLLEGWEPNAFWEREPDEFLRPWAMRKEHCRALRNAFFHWGLPDGWLEAVSRGEQALGCLAEIEEGAVGSG